MVVVDQLMDHLVGELLVGRVILWLASSLANHLLIVTGWLHGYSLVGWLII